jgi:hypothetical protein
VLAHQDLQQLHTAAELANSLLNASIRVVFRVGDSDARVLAGGFAHFEANDLTSLDTFEAICRVERSDADFNVAVDAPLPVQSHAAAMRQAVIDVSRRNYATNRAAVEKLPSEGLPDAARAEPKEPKSSTPPASPSPPSEPEPTPAKVELLSEAIPAPPREIGRGGPEHQALQRKIKEAAEALGFSGTIEKDVLGGTGFVDVSLKVGDLSIACEISHTTPGDHEVENVRSVLRQDIAW